MNTKPCNNILDLPLKKICEQAFAACGKMPPDGSVRSCASRANMCLEAHMNNKTSYPVEVFDGQFTRFSSPGKCFEYSVEATKSFGPLTRFKTVTPPGKQHQTPPLPPRTPVQDICDTHAGPRETPRHKSCLQNVESCMSDGPFPLSFEGITVIYPDSKSCFEEVSSMLDIPPSALPSPRPPDSEPAIHNPHSSGQSWQPDGQTRFEVAFDYAGFMPETGNGNESEVKLLTRYRGYTKGLDVKIRYSIEELGSGRYKMTYSIFGKENRELTGKRTLEFEAHEGRITDDLVFAITLQSEGDFATVTSVEIIRK